MSVINQVLNQLEQRGAHTASEQTMVRAVPQSRRNFALPFLVFAFALIAGIAVWQWLPLPKPTPSSVEKPSVPTVSIAVDQSVVTATTPIVSAASELVPGVPAEKPPIGLSGPASRLSFELSSIPLPSSVRTIDKPRGNPVTAALDLSENLPGSGSVVPSSSNNTHTQPGSTKATASESKLDTKGGVSPMKVISRTQQADAEFRKAVALMQQGRIADALAGYEAALRLDAGHDSARQALVALLLENKRTVDAERVLREKLAERPEHTGFAMLLARLQVDRGAVSEATTTLEKGLQYATSQADFHAFLAALLQRQNRNEEAISRYQAALNLAPNNGIWLMGYGISLQAVQRNTEAKDAFNHALNTATLSPDLQAFVQQQLKGL